MISITKGRLVSPAPASAVVATLAVTTATAAAIAATAPWESFNGFPGGLQAIAGVGTLLVISAISIGVSGVRRWQAQRRLNAHLAARLATFAGPRTVAVGAAGVNART